MKLYIYFLIVLSFAGVLVSHLYTQPADQPWSTTFKEAIQHQVVKQLYNHPFLSVGGIYATTSFLNYKLKKEFLPDALSENKVHNIFRAYSEAPKSFLSKCAHAFRALYKTRINIKIGNVGLFLAATFATDRLSHAYLQKHKVVHYRRMNGFFSSVCHPKNCYNNK